MASESFASDTAEGTSIARALFICGLLSHQGTRSIFDLVGLSDALVILHVFHPLRAGVLQQWKAGQQLSYIQKDKHVAMKCGVGESHLWYELIAMAFVPRVCGKASHHNGPRSMPSFLKERVAMFLFPTTLGIRIPFSASIWQALRCK